MIRKLYRASFVAVAALIPFAAAQAQSSFDSLSPGNQMIAEALFNAQAQTPSGPAALDLNQIADLKSTTGWGRVFQQMKKDGLIDAKNLGQVVSDHQHTLHAAALGAGNSGGTLAATTGAGHAAEGGHANDVDTSARGATGFEHHEDATSITTAGGTSVASAGAVNAGGHGFGTSGSGSGGHVGGGVGGGHGH